MANSSRPRAPRSAAAGSTATPSLPNSRALMSLGDVRATLNSVDASLDALLALLHAANGATIQTSHIEALLAPLHDQLSQASNDLNDLDLIEPPVHPLPALDNSEIGGAA